MTSDSLLENILKQDQWTALYLDILFIISLTNKKGLYKEIYHLLAPGGVLIKIEHTASATPEVEKLHDGLFVGRLFIHSKRARHEVA